GLYERARRYGALLVFTAMASLGLPGLAGFWGELYALIGADKPASGLTLVGFHILMGVAGVGMVLTATYLLLVVRRACMGPISGPNGDRYHPVPDLTRRELVSWTPLAGLTLVAGLWPAVIMALADPAVHHLLGGAR